MAENRSLLRLASVGVGIAYLYGLVLVALGLAWDELFRHRLPDWTWWEYALAPLLVGVVGAGLELLGEYFSNGFALRRPAPAMWKRYLGGVMLMLFMVLVVIGPAFYKIRNG